MNRFILLRPLLLLVDTNFNTAKYMKENQASVLILAAGNDEVIPKNCVQNLVKTINQPLVFREIKGANHQNITDFDEYYAAINEFVVMQLKKD